jgi:hypothetical protein
VPPYRVIRSLDLDEPTPLDAARKTLAAHRDPFDMPLRFEVVPLLQTPDGPVPDGSPVEIDLDLDNPLGRPLAVIKDEEVCCGHCGSKNTRYLEDAGRYSFMWVEHGTAYSQKTALTADYEGNNPRVWCAECSKESLLPDPFELLEPPKHTTPKEAKDGREIHSQGGG